MTDQRRNFPESLSAVKNFQIFSRFAGAVTKRVTAIGMIAFAIGSGLAWMESLSSIAVMGGHGLADGMPTLGICTVEAVGQPLPIAFSCVSRLDRLTF